ncbi:hypothetical protein AAG570_013324 [Ranatra chinensis]|uniref:Uncharacterized protein n=1 Tax=Ranatra chinensis TaxID=642074 RepID=A0ABD0YGQ8_9HEMI
MVTVVRRVANEELLTELKTILKDKTTYCVYSDREQGRTQLAQVNVTRRLGDTIWKGALTRAQTVTEKDEQDNITSGHDDWRYFPLAYWDEFREVSENYIRESIAGRIEAERTRTRESIGERGEVGQDGWCWKCGGICYPGIGNMAVNRCSRCRRTVCPSCSVRCRQSDTLCASCLTIRVNALCVWEEWWSEPRQVYGAVVVKSRDRVQPENVTLHFEAMFHKEGAPTSAAGRVRHEIIIPDGWVVNVKPRSPLWGVSKQPDAQGNLRSRVVVDLKELKKKKKTRTEK